MAFGVVAAEIGSVRNGLTFRHRESCLLTSCWAGGYFLKEKAQFPGITESLNYVRKELSVSSSKDLRESFSQKNLFDQNFGSSRDSKRMSIQACWWWKRWEKIVSKTRMATRVQLRQAIPAIVQHCSDRCDPGSGICQTLWLWWWQPHEFQRSHVSPDDVGDDTILAQRRLSQTRIDDQ